MLTRAPTSASAACTRRAISGLGTRRISRPKATFFSTLICGKQRVGLEDEAEIALSGRHRIDALVLEPDLAGGGLGDAGDGAQQRGLAAAGGPSSTSNRPAGISRSMPLRAGVPRTAW